MRIKGTLSKWNDDRGFGFIAPTQGGQEIFVHISAFPRGGPRPQIGERLTFEIETAGDGKKRGTNLRRLDFSAPEGRHRIKPHRPSQKRSSLVRVIWLILLIGFFIAGYFKYSHQANRQVTFTPQDHPAITTTQQFQCDGRTRCSEMTSCDEAKFFLKNCPNTQMDGNGDGVPCEQQWCKD